MTGRDHADVTHPVSEDAPKVFCTGRVAVHHHRKDTPGEVTRVGPAGQLQPFGFNGILAAGRSRIRIAAVGAYQTVDHELERRWRLIPVDWAHDHDAVRRDPLRIDFIHPVAGLPDRVIWIA